MQAARAPVGPVDRVVQDIDLDLLGRPEPLRPSEKGTGAPGGQVGLENATDELAGVDRVRGGIERQPLGAIPELIEGDRGPAGPEAAQAALAVVVDRAGSRIDVDSAQGEVGREALVLAVLEVQEPDAFPTRPEQDRRTSW